MSWNHAHWVSHIMHRNLRWDAVHTFYNNHQKFTELKDPTRLVVCDNCQSVLSDTESCYCASPQRYTFQQTRSDNAAQRAFASAWVDGIQPEGSLNPNGPDKDMKDAQAYDYQKKLCQNTDDLLEEAICLFDHGKYHRGGFLALVALEETIKMGWFSIQHINRDKSFYHYPLYGCKPGFTYKRLNLAYRGLRYKTQREPDAFAERYRFLEGQHMGQHINKLRMAIDPSNLFLGISFGLIGLDNAKKYYVLYRGFHKRNANVLEYCRYVDIDFDHGQIPSERMTRNQAYDHILFATAMFHDWAHHAGYRNPVYPQGGDETVDQLRGRIRGRYKVFVDTHSDLTSVVLPKAKLTDDDNRILRADGIE